MVTASLVKELREKTGAGMMDCKKVLTETDGDMEKAIELLRERGIAKAAKKSGRVAAEGLVEAYISEDAKTGAIVEVNSETDFVAKNDEFKSLVDTIAKAILENNVSTDEEVLNLTVDGKTIQDLIIEKTATIGEKLSFRRFNTLTKNSNEVFGTYSHMGGKIVSLVKLTGNNMELAKDIAMHIAAMRPLYLNSESVPSEVVDKERNILKEQAVNEGLAESKIDMIVNGRMNKYYEEVCLLDQFFIKENKVKVSAYLKNHGVEALEFIRYEVGEGMQKKEENFADEVMKQING